MQRRAATAYLALLVFVAVGSYGYAATSSPPPIDVAADHELRTEQSVRLNGTQYTVTDLNASAPSATLEWAAGNETDSTTVEEGTNVTLEGTTYTAHFEGRRLQLTEDQAAYVDELQEVDEHEELDRRFEVLATLGAIAALVLGAAAFMPVRGD